MIPLSPWLACHKGLRVGLHVDTREITFDASATNWDEASSIQNALIAHLERIPRFCGAAGGYSVAQHSALCRSLAGSLHVYHSGDWSKWQRLLLMHALLHDAHEFITEDIPKPAQAMLPKEARTGLKFFQKSLQIAIENGLRIPPPEEDHLALIKRIDVLALIIERRWFFSDYYHSQNWSEWSINEVEEKLSSSERAYVDVYEKNGPFLAGTFASFLQKDLIDLKNNGVLTS